MPNGTRATGLDRRRDLPGWLLTPLVTLALGPALTASVVALMALYGGVGSAPDTCRWLPPTTGARRSRSA